MLTFANYTKKKDLEKSYLRGPSFIDKLPWRDYNEKHKCFLLEDNKSLGMCFEVTPLATEVKTEKMLHELSVAFADALKNSIPCEKDPWILQFYLFKDHNLEDFYRTLQNYIPAAHKKNSLTQDYLAQIKSHLQYVSREGGIFHDHEITNASFRGNNLKIYFTLYRRRKEVNPRESNLAEIRAISRKLVSQLNACGLKIKRMDGNTFTKWLRNWFNPKLTIPAVNLNENPIGSDLAEELFFNLPASFEKGWLFNDQPHKVMTIESMTRAPAFGHLTGERKKLSDDTKIFNLIDHLEADSIFVITLVFQMQNEVKKHLKIVENSAIGRHAQALKVKHEIDMAEDALTNGDYLLPVVMNLYLKANTIADLNVKQTETVSLLNNNGFRLINDNELFPIDAYLRYLPMTYDFNLDKKNYRARLYLLSEIVKLLPFYGRNHGSGNPGIIMFNRGGEPWTYDVMKDKTKNAHLLLLGETGTGKSNFLCYMASADLALYNSIFFIHEAGGSFDLWIDYCKSHGLTCNKIKIDLENPISLNPFAYGLQVIEVIEKVKNRQNYLADLNEKLEQEAVVLKESEKLTGDEPRDFLGDMVIAALIMITGGEEKEENKIRRTDRMLIMDAIIDAAYFVRDQGLLQMRASDVIDAFERISLKLDSSRDRDKIKRARDMADAMRLFTDDPVSSQFFNSYGKPWPLVDVTVIDYGLFARDGYEAQRAIAFSGCMNNILALAEANQKNDRAIKVICDENHLFTSIPLLAQLETRIAKMGRKLGLWLWLASQNMKDFPDLARRTLSQLEQWFCLALPLDEIKQIERFKTLTDEERALFLSAKKAKGLYTEGVLLSPKIKGLFRNIPPKQFLAFVQTEQDEKNLRRKIMKEHNCSELEAAQIIAKKMMQKKAEENDD